MLFLLFADAEAMELSCSEVPLYVSSSALGFRLKWPFLRLETHVTEVGRKALLIIELRLLKNNTQCYCLVYLHEAL